MKKIHSDVYIGIIMLIFSVTVLILTFDMPKAPAHFPQIVVFFMLLFSLYIGAFGIRKTLAGDVEKKFEHVKSPMIAFALIMAYALLINYLGFFASTAIFIAAFMVYYNVKKYIVIFLTMVLVDVFVYVLFTVQLNIQLPAGILF